MKYRKKPVVIDAVQWTGENMAELEAFAGDSLKLSACGIVGKGRNLKIESVLGICTLEGFMRIDVGDFVIRGVKGEFYPCKPDIFEATYDEA